VWLPRDVLRIGGADAVEYLNGQCSQDVASLAAGESADALVLTPQGKLDALIRVTRMDDDELVIDVDGGFGEALTARLLRFRLRVKVEIEPLPWMCLALRGTATAGREDLRLPGVAVAAPFAWNEVVGQDLLGPQPELPADATLCTMAAWEAVRIEAGIPVMGAELDERTIAAEADLVSRAVSLTKGCYTGQELVARLESRGSKVARHLRGLVVEAALPDDANSVPVGTEVRSSGRTVGTVTSSAWSPGLAAPIALAYLHRAVVPPSSVELVVPRPLGDAVTVSAAARSLPLVA
jgi:folate-binding protein YgfZ